MRYNEIALTDDCKRTVIKAFHSTRAAARLPHREHHHTDCELSLFLKGRGTYAVGGRVYEFEAGDVFLFGSNEAHCITEVREDMDLLNIHFAPKLLWEHAENMELLGLFAARSKHFSHCFPHTDTALREQVLALEHELLEKRACQLITAKCLLFYVFVHMIREYDCINPERLFTSPSSTTKSLGKAIHYINEHLDEKLTLQRLAEVACMTPTYFSSVFRKFNGVSPWEYITIKRVEKAVEMLKTTDLTKLQIAEYCGFSSPSNFYKAFTRVTGKRPSDYVQS